MGGSLWGFRGGVLTVDSVNQNSNNPLALLSILNFKSVIQ